MWSEDSQEGSGVQLNCMQGKLKASWKRSEGLPFLPLIPAQQVEWAFPRALRGSRAAWEGHHPCTALCLTLAVWLHGCRHCCPWSIYLSCSRWSRQGWLFFACLFFFVIVSKKLVFCHKLGSFHSSGWWVTRWVFCCWQAGQWNHFHSYNNTCLGKDSLKLSWGVRKVRE